MALVDTTVRNAKPRPKPYKLWDADGMFLQVQPGGGKLWRFKYRFLGKEKLLALGTYPEVGLSAAREKLADARKLLAESIDPAEFKKENKRLALIKSQNTFEKIALDFCEKRKHKWVTSYSEAMIARLERHVFPKLGNRPIDKITPQEFLSVVRVVEESGSLDLAQRLLQASAQIFRYAVATGLLERSPVADLKGALKPPVRKHHAYLKETDLPLYLKTLETADLNVQTKLALKFLLLTFVRTTELRGAEWKEINFKKAEWRIPPERMKMRDVHIVPLATQSLAILAELQNQTGQGRYIFPNQHKQFGFMSENTMLYALYRMGYHSKATGHGFRATASTILNEHGFEPSVIERQLAHAERNEVRAAYNHAQYLPERRKMMQWWADYLDRAAKNK